MPNVSELERIEEDVEDVSEFGVASIGSNDIVDIIEIPSDEYQTRVGALKFDQDKARMELLPLPALEEVAKVLTFGAEKYAAHGWKSLDNAEERYLGALLRHLTAIQKGEELDPDSGLPHISHVACNAIFLTHFQMSK